MNIPSFNLKGNKTYLVLALVLIAVFVIIFLSDRPGQKPMVAGAETKEDPNHPVESYFGSPNFDTLDKMLNDLGVEVYPEDIVHTVPPPGVGIGSQITIERALPIEVTDAKNKRVYRTWQETVGDLLKEKNIELLGKDTIDPSEDTLLKPGMKIKITRVAEVEVTQEEVINFKTIKKYNASMEKGTKNILEKGKNGKKANTFLITRKDGEEISRKLLKSEITQEPVNEVAEIGTWVKVYGDGAATWYGVWPRAAKTTNNAYYAASKTIPRGTEVWVVNKENGKGVKVTILDWVEADVAIDLSKDAFAKIASLGAGVIDVRIEKYYPNS